MPKNEPLRRIDSQRTRVGAIYAGGGVGAGGGGGGGGVTDHGALTGLLDDDHSQYHNDMRGDARYVPLARLVAAGAGLTGGGALSGDIALSLASSAAGAGLTYGSGVLAVGAGLGITVNADDVALASTVAGAGLTYASGVLNVGAGLGITVNANDVALASSVAGDGLTYALGILAVGVANTGAAGLTVEADTIRLTSSSNPGAAAAVLASDASGLLTLPQFTATTKVRTPLLDTASGAMTLQPATDLLLQPTSNLVKLQGGVALQSANYASQTTGMRATYDGQGDFRYLYTDEMHAKSFIADLEQALAGGQIISKSVTSLASAFTAPQIAFRSKASGTSSTTSLGVNKPTGTAQYDVMVAAVIHSASTSVSAAPSGWTLLLTRTQGTTTMRVYWKPAGASEGSSYTWTLANSGQSLGTIYSFINVDNASPIDAYGSQGNTSSTSVTAPTITTATAATRLLFLAGFYDANVTGASAAAPAGFAEEEDTTGGTATWSYGADYLFSGTGATGARTATLANAHLSAAALIALKPTASPVAALTVRDLPSAEHMQCFQTGDIIRLRQYSRAGGALSIADCWGAVSNPVDNNDKTQTWSFTRSAAPNAGTMAPGTVIAADAIVLDYGTSGNGFYEVNAIDGLYGANSPYWQVVTWSTHPATGQTSRARGGNLYGIFAQANEYGLYAGTGTANTDSYLRISNNVVRLNNVPLQLWNSTNQTVNISSTGTDVWIGTSSADKRLTWDGSTLTVKGAIVVQSGSSGYANIADKPTSLGGINSTEGTKLGGIAAGATVGATWGVNMTPPARFGDSPAGAGLYLTASNMGYWDGGAWKTWMASTGQFYFGGSTGASLRWDGSKLSGYDLNNTEQWYGGASDGVLSAGSGNVALWYGGLSAIQEVGSITGTRIAFYTASNRATRTAFIASYTDSSSILPYYNSNVLQLQAEVTTGKASPRILLNNPTIVNGQLAASSLVNTGGASYSDNAFWFYNLTGSSTQSVAVGNLYDQGGLILSDNTIQLRNWANSSYQNLSTNTIVAAGSVSGTALGTSGGGVYSDNPFQFLTNGGAAQILRAGSLLTSSDYGSTYTSRVPSQGIYARGAIRTSDVYAIDYRTTNAAPGSGLMYMYILQTPSDGKYRLVIAYNDGSGTTRYMWANMSSIVGSGSISWSCNTAGPT